MQQLAIYGSEMSQECFVHLKDECNKLLMPLSTVRWEKLQACAAQWKDLPCSEGLLAARVSNHIKILIIYFQLSVCSLQSRHAL